MESSCRDLLRQAAVEGSLRLDPAQTADRAVTITGASALEVDPTERRREKEPLPAAVVGVCPIAMDAAVDRDKVRLDPCERRGEGRVVRRDEAVRRGDPEQAGVDRVAAVPFGPRTGPAQAGRDPRLGGDDRPLGPGRRAHREQGSQPGQVRRQGARVDALGGLLPGIAGGQRPESSQVPSGEDGGRGQVVGEDAARGDVSPQCPQPDPGTVELERGPIVWAQRAVGRVAAVEVVSRVRTTALAPGADRSFDPGGRVADDAGDPGVKATGRLVLADEIEALGDERAVTQPRVTILAERRAGDERATRGLACVDHVEAGHDKVPARHPFIAPWKAPLTM